MLNNLKEKKDALILIGLSAAVLLFGNLLAWAGIAYGIWTLTQED
jgi:hypothetical protein|tara:strand:+ start:715 stop:849 length:135 start_codon:yes stop_codon:yes gene_type:complete